MSKTPLALAFYFLLAGAVFAQQSGMDHGAISGMDKGLVDSMTRMNKDMPMSSAGSVDADFVRMMIPHHQAAVDMAEVELAKGKDPELRKLASDIIVAQKKEIAQMNGWLQKNNIK